MNMETSELLYYLHKQTACVKINTIATDLCISRSCASYHLRKLRKQKRVGLYLHRYWGIVSRGGDALP